MKDIIGRLITEIEAYLPENAVENENFRLKYLSKKGAISILFDDFRLLAPDEKREVGKMLNELKNLASSKFETFKELFEKQQTSTNNIDVTLPGEPGEIGSRHPVSLLISDICSVFTRIGYTLSHGPEIEDDDHNFARLNFAPDHPARDMQDTFFITPDLNILLRTHTSSVQAHEMQEMKPPIRTISPGRVYRNEAVSARSHCQFHQVEGLYIDENVSFADLKQTLLYFAKEMFGEQTRIRLRPSFFPFTEPSAEMDVSCTLCGGKGCRVCKNTGWLEVLGCGMVDPNVFDAAGIDSQKYTGFAFGIGVERMAMLKFGVNDIRLYFENDLRFLKQFKTIY
ncbi:MAG: phenylalanine--tRNA ligase subunit alpha [Bacteroidales bacterium]|nr:phenylalanine--tRNA ligase subunit alpha [Bacteroidales bacterium]HOY39333.1 phenylalanine--tRNA ligase subunit alpha [Bacteroidales bacterium]HQP02977.1 phenylalanine--tRNA ligase subunit alpha [Bacteroidales bacterium]